MKVLIIHLAQFSYSPPPAVAKLLSWKMVSLNSLKKIEKAIVTLFFIKASKLHYSPYPRLVFSWFFDFRGNLGFYDFMFL